MLMLMCNYPHPVQAAPRRIKFVAPKRPRAPQNADEMAAEIVDYARSRMGNEVGDGECYDLADRALHSVGARSAPDYGEITADADYVWGEQVPLSQARPGDIVQFHNFNIVTTIVATTRLPDGRTYTTQTWEQDQREHHTSILEENLGNSFSLLEQNVPPDGMRVQRTIVPVLSETLDHVQGDPNASGTTQIEVAGEVRVYRPVPGEQP
jgi:hypothetical protein